MEEAREHNTFYCITNKNSLYAVYNIHVVFDVQIVCTVVPRYLCTLDSLPGLGSVDAF